MVIRKRINIPTQKVYRCVICGTMQVCLTSHTNDCWPICQGSCRNIVQADEYNPRRESITQTLHEYVRDYSGPKVANRTVVK